jgi:hypothetical protein
MDAGFLLLLPFVAVSLLCWALNRLAKLEQREANTYRDSVLMDVGNIDIEYEVLMRRETSS